MNNKYINEQIEKLPISDLSDFFLKYKPTVNEEEAKSLVGKLIYFTWSHKINGEEKMFTEEISGKVLEYKDNKLLIYTNYVLMLEEDLKDINNSVANEFIQSISLNDITNVAEFKNYMFEGWEILPDDYYGNIYEVTNTEDKIITALAYDCDGFNVYLIVKQKINDKIEILRKKYPLVLIKSLKKI